MKQSNTDSVDSFSPAPGFLLIETIEEQSQFKPKQEVNDATCRKGKVLKIGKSFLNEHGNEVVLPDIKVGDIVLFWYRYQNEELEIDYKKYPIVQFNAIRGVFK